MPQTCCICAKFKSEGESKNKGRSLHRFPLKNPELVQIWKKNLQLKSNFEASSGMRVCSDHFVDECFIVGTSRRQLKPGSVPTLIKSKCSYCSSLNIILPGQSNHRFPVDPLLSNAWIGAVREYNANINEHCILCSAHFEKTCFRNDKNGQRLKRNAVPSIFMPDLLKGLAVDHSSEITLMNRSTNGSNATMTSSATTSNSSTQDIIARLMPLTAESTAAVEGRSPLIKLQGSSHNDHQYGRSSKNVEEKLVEARKAKKLLGLKVQSSKKKVQRLEKKNNVLQNIVQVFAVHEGVLHGCH